MRLWLHVPATCCALGKKIQGCTHRFGCPPIVWLRLAVKQILGSLWYKDKHKIYLNAFFLIKIYFLVKKDSDLDMYSRTRAILKSLNVDQYAIADKFGIKQSSISLALNGKNEKTFLRIVALLEKEYGVNSADIFEDPKTVSQGLQEQLAEIKAELAASREELKQVLEGMEELKGMLKK